MISVKGKELRILHWLKGIIVILICLPIFSWANNVQIATAAQDQVGKTLIYDPSYTLLAYPMGDIPLIRGVCTDVVIRALRSSHKVDLQQLVHEDMRQQFAVYPKTWGLTKPDKNIDHRRVPNLEVFLSVKEKVYQLLSNLKIIRQVILFHGVWIMVDLILVLYQLI